MTEEQTSPYRTRPRGLPAQALHRADDGLLREAQTKAAEHLEGWQRARADYENLRKRFEAERSEAGAAATDALLKALLPIVDYFDAALREIPEQLQSDSWTKGILQIHQVLRGFLQGAGVTPLEELGMPFDPQKHEVVAEEASEQPVGTVVGVVARGYLRQGRVLRPAKVQVSSGPASEESSGPPLASRPKKM